MLSLITLILASSLSFAADLSWEEAYVHEESASTPATLQVLVNRHPGAFPDVRPQDLANASITIRYYVLRGETTCARNDVRANYVGTSAGYCTHESIRQSPSTCVMTAIPMPPQLTEDPCKTP